MRRKVIVTGGSRGLGLGIVRRLICDGYDAIAIARQMNDQLSSAIEHADRTRPGSLRFIPFDLGDVSEIPALVKDIRREAGPIYGLVNNAALGTAAVLALMPTAQIERLVRLNTLSPIVLTKHVVGHMMADGGGRVVNVASIVGFTGYSGLSVTARRGVADRFTRSLAREVGSAASTSTRWRQVSQPADRARGRGPTGADPRGARRPAPDRRRRQRRRVPPRRARERHHRHGAHRGRGNTA